MWPHLAPLIHRPGIRNSSIAGTTHLHWPKHPGMLSKLFKQSVAFHILKPSPDHERSGEREACKLMHCHFHGLIMCNNYSCRALAASPCWPIANGYGVSKARMFHSEDLSGCQVSQGHGGKCGMSRRATTVASSTRLSRCNYYPELTPGMERPKRWCHRRAYLKQASNNRYAEVAGDCWVETEGTTVRQHAKTEDCGRGYGSTVFP
jgi:hypothetical protein